MSSRPVDAKELCHERLGDQFAEALSGYDTDRRVATLIDRFFPAGQPNDLIRGKTVLDVGCGLGFFSQRLMERGANVIACDLGPTLVEKTRQRAACAAQVADALRLTEEFGENKFDLVVSSECIEHTPSPAQALRQMAAVVKPGGYMAVSTPNIVWYPVVKFATMMKLRPFDGFENFSSWGSIRTTLQESGVEVVQEFGLHIFPFQLGLHSLSIWADEHLQSMRALMINICVLGRKRRLT